MTPNRILLVNADYPNSHYRHLILPVGLGYISESLSRNRIEHKVFDLGLGGGYRKLKKLILSYNPDLIGYSFMSFRYKYNYAVLDALKRDLPKIKIIAGGPHISTFRKKALLDCQAIDIGVLMEGEETLIDICNGMPLNEIRGIVYRDKNANNIVETGPRDLIEDLDALGFPRYEKFGVNNYPRTIPLVTSRGCPYQCIFCPIASVMGRGFRTRSATGLIDEIEFWHKNGIRDFSIADDVFNFITQRVYDICNEIDKRHLSGLRIRCSNGIRADKVDEGILMRMKKSGFYCLAFGVESGSDKVLKNLKKGENAERIEEAIRQACRLGFWVELFFLIGSPGEAWPDFEESVKLALRYPVCDAKFYNLIPFPQTELYGWLEERNYFLISPPDHLDNIMHHINEPVFATPEFSLNQRKKAFRYAASVIAHHTKARRIGFEKWLTKEKLRDYYCIEGLWADLLAFFYCRGWGMQLMQLFSRYFTAIKTFKRTIFLSIQAARYWAPHGYNAERYWKDRLSSRGLTLCGVGDISSSPEDNEQSYLKAKEVFLSFCRKEQIDFRKIRMLDIGCGAGFYAGIFIENGGEKYTGIDITEVLFSKLKKKFPKSEFYKLNVCTQKLSGYFDLIIMIDVTQHITDNSRFSFAMQNVKSHLSENGIFILTSWLSGKPYRSLYEVSRTIDIYKREFPGYIFSRPFPFRDKFIFSIKKHKQDNLPL